MTVPVLIQPHMEVLGSDGDHVGVVDHIENTSEVRLAKDDPDAGGEYRFIPLAWIRYVGMKVHLNQPADEAKAHWTTH
jgi:hypothetical protein